MEWVNLSSVNGSRSTRNMSNFNEKQVCSSKCLFFSSWCSTSIHGNLVEKVVKIWSRRKWFRYLRTISLWAALGTFAIPYSFSLTLWIIIEVPLTMHSSFEWGTCSLIWWRFYANWRVAKNIAIQERVCRCQMQRVSAMRMPWTHILFDGGKQRDITKTVNAIFFWSNGSYFAFCD